LLLLVIAALVVVDFASGVVDEEEHEGRSLFQPCRRVQQHQDLVQVS
jgi:hypothetical protein